MDPGRYPGAPETIAVHFGAGGDAFEAGSTSTLLWLSLLMVVVIGGCHWLSHFPRLVNHPFMIQLVGYNEWRRAQVGRITAGDATEGIDRARCRMGNVVHATSLRDSAMGTGSTRMVPSMTDTAAPRRFRRSRTMTEPNPPA